MRWWLSGFVLATSMACVTQTDESEGAGEIAPLEHRVALEAPWAKSDEYTVGLAEVVPKDADESRKTAIADSYMMGFSSGRMHALTVSRLRFEKTVMEKLIGQVKQPSPAVKRKMAEDSFLVEEAIVQEEKRFDFLRTTLRSQSEGDGEAWNGVEMGVRQGRRFAARVFREGEARAVCETVASRWRRRGLVIKVDDFCPL